MQGGTWAPACTAEAGYRRGDLAFALFSCPPNKGWSCPCPSHLYPCPSLLFALPKLLDQPEVNQDPRTNRSLFTDQGLLNQDPSPLCASTSDSLVSARKSASTWPCLTLIPPSLPTSSLSRRVPRPHSSLPLVILYSAPFPWVLTGSFPSNCRSLRLPAIPVRLSCVSSYSLFLSRASSDMSRVLRPLPWPRRKARLHWPQIRGHQGQRAREGHAHPHPPALLSMRT